MVNTVELKRDIKDALQCLWYWKYRTLISAVGIAIGTTALIVMMSISEGARQEAEQSIKLLGLDTIRLETNLNRSSTNQSGNRNLATGLTFEDLKRLQNFLPNTSIAAFKYKQQQSVLIGNNNVFADVLLVNDNWLSAEKLSFNLGRDFKPLDTASGTQVCIVGNEFISNSNLILSKVVSWSGYSCRVTGALNQTEKRIVEGSVLANIDLNQSIILPISQYSSVNRYLTGITIKLQSEDVTEIVNTANNIKLFLGRFHKVEDYTIYTPASLLDKYEDEQRLFNLVMGTIAGLSLVVGGIGILNVMLAKVAEQTREIGLRKAIGATELRIKVLFLSYSVVLSLVGTVFGVFLGIVSTLILQFIIDWPISFSAFSLSVGPIFAFLSGLVFGLYPAIRAAQISPYSALRQL